MTRTAFRYLRDRFAPAETNGDVVVKWPMENSYCSTFGHVFTHGEIITLAKNSRLTLKSRTTVDYESGAIRRFGFQGNLLYSFHRSSANDSASEATTASTSSVVI